MWRCSKCGEEIEGSFNTCWKCGTGQNGVPDEDFEPEPEDPPVPNPVSETGPPKLAPAQAEFPPVDELVTIATYDFPANAEIERQVLEDEGIRTFMADDNLVAMNWFLSNAVGGAKLIVTASNAPRAIEILEVYREANADLQNDRREFEITFACELCGCGMTFPGERRGRVEVCPHCGQYVDVPE